MEIDKREKLKNWARKTIDIYVNLAHKPQNNLAFYQQTPLTEITEDVKTVVLGINPGYGGTYSDQMVNPVWEMNGKDATEMHLLRGNFPSWHEHNKWRFVKNLCRLLDVPELNDKEVVITNETFFSTAKVREINQNLIDNTIECSLNLIEILNPQIVLCLSAKDCFDRIKSKCPEQFKSVDVFGNALKLGMLDGRIYLGIYHPAFYYPNQLTELIRKSIKIVREHSKESLDVVRTILLNECKALHEAYLTRPKTKNNWQVKAAEVRDLIFQHDGFLPYIKVEHESPSQDGNLIIRIDSRIYAKFVVQSGKNYISWMHSDYEKKPFKATLQKYELRDCISKILDCYGFDDHSFELGRKSLSSYGTNDVNELTDQVVFDINQIAEEINAIAKRERRTSGTLSAFG